MDVLSLSRLTVCSARGPHLSRIVAHGEMLLQATDIDVSNQCAAGHGRVTCWTAYCGPDVNFARDDLAVQPGSVPECVLYVDTFLSGDADVPEVVAIWQELREFLESEEYPKVCTGSHICIEYPRPGPNNIAMDGFTAM